MAKYRIELENFMGVDNAVIDLGGFGTVTSIYGTNESGKSSVIHALNVLLFGDKDIPYHNYIKHWSRGFTIRLLVAQDEGSVDELRLRRTKSGGTWSINGQVSNQDEVSAWRRSNFWPGAFQNVRMNMFLRPEKFVSANTRDRNWSLVSALGDITPEVNAVLSWPEMGKWVEEIGHSINTADNLKSFMDHLEDTRRAVKRYMAASGARLKRLHNVLTDMHAEYIYGSVEEAEEAVEEISNSQDQLNRRLYQLSEEIGENRALDRNSTFLRAKSTNELPFDLKHGTESYRAIYKFVEARYELAQVLAARNKYKDQNVDEMYVAAQDTLERAKSDYDSLKQELQTMTEAGEARNVPMLILDEENRIARIDTLIDAYSLNEVTGVYDCHVCGSTEDYTGSSLERAVMRHDEEKERSTALLVSLREEYKEYLRVRRGVGGAVRRAELAVKTAEENLQQVGAVMLVDITDELVDQLEQRVSILKETAVSLIPSSSVLDDLLAQRAELLDERNELEDHLNCTKEFIKTQRIINVVEEKRSDGYAKLDEIRVALETIGHNGLVPDVLNHHFSDVVRTVSSISEALTVNSEGIVRGLSFCFSESAPSQCAVLAGVEKDQFVTPYELQSESAKSRSRTALGLAFAKYFDFPFLVVDNFENWDGGHRTAFLDFYYASLASDQNTPSLILLNAGEVSLVDEYLNDDQDKHAVLYGMSSGVVEERYVINPHQGEQVSD